MKRPTLLEGILVALVLSLLLTPLAALLQILVGSLLTWKVVAVVVAYTYIGYLLIQSGRTRGRVTLGLLALAVLLAGLTLGMRLTNLLLLCVALIWGIRSVVYSRSLVSAVLQGVVCLLGCGAALQVYAHSGSMACAVWSFFLLQAAFVLIPARFTRPSASALGEQTGSPLGGFVRAYHAANAALGRMERSRA